MLGLDSNGAAWEIEIMSMKGSQAFTGAGHYYHDHEYEKKFHEHISLTLFALLYIALIE